MARKVDVIKAVNKLPYEAIQQIENILSDDNLKLKDVSIGYIIEDVKWTVTRLDMDLGDMEGEEYQKALKDKKACLKWLKYYSKYI
jgi:hypothetical protein